MHYFIASNEHGRQLVFVSSVSGMTMCQVLVRPRPPMRKESMSVNQNAIEVSPFAWSMLHQPSQPVTVVSNWPRIPNLKTRTVNAFTRRSVSRKSGVSPPILKTSPTKIVREVLLTFLFYNMDWHPYCDFSSFHSHLTE